MNLLNISSMLILILIIAITILIIILMWYLSLHKVKSNSN